MHRLEGKLGLSFRVPRLNLPQNHVFSLLKLRTLNLITLCFVSISAYHRRGPLRPASFLDAITYVYNPEYS